MPIYAIILLSHLLSPIAHAQTAGSPLVAMARSFPADVKRGVLTAPFQHQLQISGKVFNAASGLQIRNERNLIIMPATLQGAFPIRYQFDQSGNVWRIWILTPAEQAEPDPKK